MLLEKERQNLFFLKHLTLYLRSKQSKNDYFKVLKYQSAGFLFRKGDFCVVCFFVLCQAPSVQMHVCLFFQSTITPQVLIILIFMVGNPSLGE